MEARYKMKETIHNAITGEIIERDLPKDVIAEYEAKNAASEKLAKEIELQQTQRAAARQAVLDKLGLTADEVAALLA